MQIRFDNASTRRSGFYFLESNSLNQQNKLDSSFLCVEDLRNYKSTESEDISITFRNRLEEVTAV